MALLPFHPPCRVQPNRISSHSSSSSSSRTNRIRDRRAAITLCLVALIAIHSLVCAPSASWRQDLTPSDTLCSSHRLSREIWEPILCWLWWIGLMNTTEGFNEITPNTSHPHPPICLSWRFETRTEAETCLLFTAATCRSRRHRSTPQDDSVLNLQSRTP